MPDPDLPGKEGGFAYLDEHCRIQSIAEPLYHTHKSNIILYVNSTGNLKKKREHLIERTQKILRMT